MNVPVPSATGPEIVTQESLLLGAAERIDRIRQGRLAIHVHLSRLRPQNRQDGHIRIALRMLEPMINAYRGQMFLLGNSDVVFMLKDPNLTDVENMVFKLRALFSKDPLTFVDKGDGRDNFCTWFDLGVTSDYEAFVGMSRTVTEEARQRSRDKAKARVELPPIDPTGLGEVMEALAAIDVSGMIRRQAAIVIDGTSAEVLFQEFYIAMAELQKALAADMNLLGNRWLFQHLSQTLDLRVLSALQDMALRKRPNMFSLNLNIASVLSKQFDDFEKSESTRSALSVEFQVLDVLADSRGYYAARERLREVGHQVVLDGLNELTLQFMDVTQFDADLYKVTWSPEMGEGEHGDITAAAMAPLGMEKILLARCDSESAIQWGLNQGIQRFQGRYVDAMLAAYTMAGCNKSSACTLGQCIARHGVVAGPMRSECGNNDMLDSSPSMRMPKPRRTPEATA
ncbi:MAG TPA: hypothetical protein VK558_01995 [Patescibacteria group bacterium]|nr:hypothetical protein [Patescibacteria group bacterium]